jgi:hypothetical protein
MAAFVASCCPEGEQVSKGYCDVVEQWATELEHELSCSKQAFTDATEKRSSNQRQLEQKELKMKITMCHYLVVIAFGCSAAPATVTLRNLETFAAQICRNMLLVRPWLLFCSWLELPSWVCKVYRVSLPETTAVSESACKKG